MNALLPATFNGGISTKFAGVKVNDDLSSGIQSSFGIVGYKGKVWSIRYRGDEEQLMRDDGDGARGSIEVVILNASQAVSKIWYEQGYVEGSNAAPDCFSNNGVTPEPTSAKKQCDTCAACKHNAWGSRITPAGKQGKACSDSKRIAVVPMQDIPNEAYGGPMLLRVPAASLQDIAMYGGKMQQMGYPYFSVATRIAFDPAESYPKFQFSAIRPLTDDEAELVVAMREGHQVERILSENEFAAAPETPAADDKPLFEQPPEDVTSKGNDDAAKADAEAKAKAAAEAKAKADAAAKKKAETAAKKKAMEEEAARLEAEAAAASEAEAANAAGAEDESEEDRELREMEERLAAARAKKAAAAATTASGSQPSTAKQAEASKSEAGQTATTTASHSDEEEGEKSGFESELDSMLDGLLT